MADRALSDVRPVVLAAAAAASLLAAPPAADAAVHGAATCRAELEQVAGAPDGVLRGAARCTGVLGGTLLSSEPGLARMQFAPDADPCAARPVPTSVSLRAPRAVSIFGPAYLPIDASLEAAGVAGRALLRGSGVADGLPVTVTGSAEGDGAGCTDGSPLTLDLQIAGTGPQAEDRSAPPPSPPPAEEGALQVTVAPKRLPVGSLRTFRIVALDEDGRRVPGARIAFAGRRATTSSAGTASIRWRPRRAGLVTVRASREGATDAVTRVRVLRRSSARR